MRTKREVVAGIYKITCLLTGSVYIGSSIDLYRRLSEYKEPKMGCVSKDIKDSIITHGIDNHEFKVLCVFDSDISVKDLHAYEDVFILLYLERLGEDKIINARCNDSIKWMSKRLKLSYKKNGAHVKCGKDNNSSKKVNQITLDDKFVKTWDSMADVKRELCIAVANISKCCKGERNHAGGFKWRFN